MSVIPLFNQAQKILHRILAIQGSLYYHVPNKAWNKGDIRLNPQFKKGVLEMCVLCSLQGGDKYGFELISHISRGISMAEGTVYPLSLIHIYMCIRDRVSMNQPRWSPKHLGSKNFTPGNLVSMTCIVLPPYSKILPSATAKRCWP